MVTLTSTLSLGRFLLGVGAGIHNVAFSKLINETIPTSVMSSFAMATNASTCIGFMVVFFLGAVLPDPEDLQANKDDEMWRVIWLGPAVVGIVMILLVLFVMRLEPILFSVMKGDTNEGIEHLRKVYRPTETESDETYQ